MASPKKRGYVVTSQRLSREEKIERAREYNEFCGETVIDPEEFAKQELFDSWVDMKCLACGRRKLVPKSIHDEEKGSEKKNPNS